jgi:uncharacterized protein (DUF1919 family)
MARLDLIEEYLNEFDKIPVKSNITFQKKLEKPWKIAKSFPATEVRLPPQLLFDADDN